MDRLQRFFSDSWAIRRHDFDSCLALVMPSVMAGRLAEAARQLAVVKCNAQATGAPYMAKWYELDDMSLPADSVAVLTLKGVLYSWETEWLISQLEQAEANPRICGIVLRIDGPGGMVDKVDQAVAKIKECTKPVATFTPGMMCSAHFWLGTSSSRTFAASPMCEAGSVGIVISYYGMRKFYEMNGIDYHEIYPDTADLKNRATRAIDNDGDETLMRQRAERIHRQFAQSVATNLGIGYDAKLPLFRGETFTADEAVKLGYIDQLGSIDDAVRYVLAKATAQKAAKMY